MSSVARKDCSETTPAATEALPVWSEDQKSAIGNWVAKYAAILLIGDFEIVIEFHNEPCADSAGTSMDICANYPYRSGNRLHVYPHMLKWDAKGQEERVIHELIHVVTDQLYDTIHKILVKEMYVTWREAKERNEALTDHLTSIIARLTCSPA